MLWTERSLWGIGTVAVALFVFLSLGSRLTERYDRQAFWDEIRAGAVEGPAAHADPGPPAVAAPPPPVAVLQEPASRPAEWSETRIRKYESARAAPLPGAPLAILEVPAAELEVLVLEGTDDWTLNRAVGWIEGTARPGSAGNVGIAGHRDGFFRGLRHVREGDQFWLTTPSARYGYQVERIRIVQPNAVEVLAPTPAPTLTLVTCYPFYFVGSAPQRLILSARQVSKEPPLTGQSRENPPK